MNTNTLLAALASSTNEQLEERLASFNEMIAEAKTELAKENVARIERMGLEFAIAAKRVAATVSDVNYSTHDKTVQVQEYARALHRTIDACVESGGGLYKEQIAYYETGATMCRAILVGRGYAADFGATEE